MDFFKRLKQVNPYQVGATFLAINAFAMLVLAAVVMGVSVESPLDERGKKILLWASCLFAYFWTMFVAVFGLYKHSKTDARLRGLADYVEELRAYTVPKIDSIEDFLEKNSRGEEIPPPPTMVPTEPAVDKRLSNKERDYLLNIIGAMLELNKKPRTGVSNDTTVINSLIDMYPKKSGLSQRNLQDKFAAAKRSLLSN